MKRKMCALLSLALVLSLFLTSCGGSSSSQPPSGAGGGSSLSPAATDWAKENNLDIGTETTEELYELAKQEGKVVLYSISSRCVKVKESFEAQYPGVVCEVYDIATNELLEKITREYDAGVRNADLIHVKDMDGSIYEEKVMTGIFHNYYPEDICANIDDKYLQYAMPLYIELSQWFYNKELNSEAPVNSWWDLTRPEWKGKLLLTNPLDNNNYMAPFTQFVMYADEFEANYEEVFGEPLVLSENCPTAAHELLKRLVDNDLVFISSSDEICESVGTPGQTGIAPLGYAASSKLRKNESDGWVLEPINMSPATGIVNQNNLYIVNECPHPNAAKLLLRWMLGEADGKGAGFEPFNTLGGWPVRNDVAPAEGSIPLEDIAVWPQDPTYIYENINEMTDFWIMLQS